MLMDEDEHIAYKEPYSMAILRSFALNHFNYTTMKIKAKSYLLARLQWLKLKNLQI